MDRCESLIENNNKMYRLVQNRNTENRVLDTLSDLIVELANQEEKERLERQPKTHPPISTARSKQNAQQAVQRIYARYRQTQEHLNKMRQKHLVNQSAQNRDFRVANSKSKQIISRKPSKPLFERSQQIINQKEFRLHNQRMRREGATEEANQQLTNRSKKPFNMRSFQDKMEKREHERKEFINNKRAEQLAESFAELQEKPVLGDRTYTILNRNKDFYGKDVINRFEDYMKKSSEELAAKKRFFGQTITPFVPKLTDKSKLLASRSIHNLHNGKNVFERVSKSPSTKCAKQHHRDSPNMSPIKNSKSAKSLKYDLHDVTFSTPRSILKNTSRVRFSQTSKESFTPIIKKLDLKFEDEHPEEDTHRASFSPKLNRNEDHDRASTQRGERQQILKDVVYNNRDEVIQFIKQLILMDRKQ